jgi:hypothetical protein
MGIPLTIFSLYRLDGDGGACSHPLLLRVRQAGFSNADAGEEDHAIRSAEERRRALIDAYRTGVLAAECDASHAVRLVGELQARPAGDVLDEGRGGSHVDVWVAQTRYGAPWVVLGTGEDEAAFWRAVREDDDLAALGPVAPAERLRAYFLTDEGLGPGDAEMVP